MRSLGAANKTSDQERPAQRRPQHHLQAARRGRPGARVPQLHAAGRHGRRRAACSCWACAKRRPSPSATCAFRPTSRAAWTASCACARALADPALREQAVRRYVRQAVAADRPELAAAAGGLCVARAGAVRRRRTSRLPTASPAPVRAAGDVRFHGSQCAGGRAQPRRRGAGAHPQRRAVRAGPADARAGRACSRCRRTREPRPS